MLLYNFNSKNKIYDEFDNTLNDYDFRYSDCFCGEKNYKIISTKTRNEQNFTTVKCKKCGTFRINPYLNEDSIDKYYKNLYGKIKRGNISPKNLHDNQKKSSLRIFQFLEKYLNKDMKILDFGGGAGGKSVKFIDNNYTIFITDSDKNYMDYAISIGFKEFDSNIKYDLILLIHVLEHISNPNDFLQFIKSLLNINGFLYIEIPYLGGKEYNNSIIEEIHIAHKWYFTKYSLIALLLKNGFKIIETNDLNGGILFSIDGEEKNSQEEINKLYKVSKKNSKNATIIAFFVKLKREIIKKFK